ncbi:MAG: hypothetical protein L6R36_009054 [Xanthoria steineri]|nr:MAG: hypothetical protein L6R36_009054 [Xanthoria steineri]
MQGKTLFFMLFTRNKYSQLEPVKTTLIAYQKILKLTCTDGEDMHQALTRALGGGSPLIGSVFIQESETFEPVMRGYMSHRELAQILQAHLDKYKILDEEVEVGKPTAPTGTDDVHRARTSWNIGRSPELRPQGIAVQIIQRQVMEHNQDTDLQMANWDYPLQLPGLKFKHMTVAESRRLCDDIARDRRKEVSTDDTAQTFTHIYDHEVSEERFEIVWEQAVGPDVPIEEALLIEKFPTRFVGYISHDLMLRAVHHHMKRGPRYIYETSMWLSAEVQRVVEGNSSGSSHEHRGVEHRSLVPRSRRREQY